MTKVLEFCRQHKIVLAFVLPIVFGLIFIVLASLNLNQSIWFDEAYSSYLIRGNFADIWNATAFDVHPPLYYFLLKIWSVFFGHSEFALRLMSVFFGTIAIVLVFKLINRWFGLKAATVATFLVSISPLIIRYGQEMRMYTLAIICVLAATLALNSALATKERKYFIWYGVFLALGMWTHYFVAFVWIAQLIYLLIIYRKRNRKFLKDTNIRWAYGTAIALFLPWLPWLCIQFFVVQIGFWTPPITMATPLDFWAESLFTLESTQVTGWMVILGLAIIALMIVLFVQWFKKASKKDRYRLFLIACMIILPPTLLMLVSMPPLKTLYVTRYVLHSTLFLWALAGVLIVHYFMKGKKFYKLAAISLGIGLMGCATIGLITVETRADKNDVQALMADIKEANNDQKPILAPTEYIYFDAIHYDSEQTPVYGVNDWYSYYYGAHKTINQYHYHVIDDLDDFLNNNKTLWLVVDSDNIDLEKQNLVNKGYHVIDKIANEKHSALKLQK